MKLWIDFLCFSELNALRYSILAGSEKFMKLEIGVSERQLKFKRIHIYAHETVVKEFVNLHIELSSIFKQ